MHCYGSAATFDGQCRGRGTGVYVVQRLCGIRWTLLALNRRVERRGKELPPRPLDVVGAELRAFTWGLFPSNESLASAASIREADPASQ